MKRYTQVSLVVAGYVAALLIAIGAVAMNNAMLSDQGDAGSGGMQAFGDLLLFLGVFGLAAVPATVGALVLLRSKHRFWRPLAIAAVTIAVTGFAACVIYLAAQTPSGNAFFDEWSALAVLRILVAPWFALAFFLSGVLAPIRSDRRALLAAAAVEALVFASVLLTWMS